MRDPIICARMKATVGEAVFSFLCYVLCYVKAVEVFTTQTGLLKKVSG